MPRLTSNRLGHQPATRASVRQRFAFAGALTVEAPGFSCGGYVTLRPFRMRSRITFTNGYLRQSHQKESTGFSQAIGQGTPPDAGTAATTPAADIAGRGSGRAAARSPPGRLRFDAPRRSQHSGGGQDALSGLRRPEVDGRYAGWLPVPGR